MENPRNTYKLYTVRELIENLQEFVENSNYLSMDSEVVISDFNFSGFREKLKLEPVNLYGNRCVGLFHTLQQDEVSEIKQRNKVSIV